jgi:hypothetical protein
MESCVMDKLHIELWGASLTAEGVVAVIAACLIAIAIIFVRRRRS